MKERYQLLLIIIVSTLIRCVIAASIGLGNDEVYYVTYAQHLQWNYFDHPPMVALLIRLTTFNLFFTSEFFIRLGPILLSAINTYLVFDICTKIKNKNAGLIAALLFSCSFYSSIIAGVFIMPDAPQLFFWIISASLLIKIVSDIEKNKNYNTTILIFGVVAGLCIMSKIHGVFLWIGFGLYILFYKRSLLSNGNLYLSMLISLAIISPILIWNIENNFITYTFHSNRIAVNNGINPNSFFREFLGGIFYNNPINYFLISMALVAVWKNKISISQPLKSLLLLLSLPLIGLLLFISLFRDTLPHWSGPAFLSLIILTACFLAETMQDLNTNFRPPKLVVISCVFIVFISIIGTGLINYFPGTIGNVKGQELGTGDFTLDMYDWGKLRNEFEKTYLKNKKNKKTNTTFIINNKWFPGAHIDNYIAQPLDLDFIAIGKIEDIHTYKWLNSFRKKLNKGDDAYFITVSNNYIDPKKQYKMIFEKINPPEVIQQLRNKKPARNMYIYLLEGYKGR